MKKSAGRDACGFDCEKCDLRPATECVQNTEQNTEFENKAKVIA